MAEALKFKMSGLVDSFTANGNNSTFALNNPVNKILNVTVNGYATTAYSISGDSLTFTAPPGVGSAIVITYEGWTAIPTVKGKDGKSAYQAAKEGGLAGNVTEASFNASLAQIGSHQTIINATGLLKGNGNGSVTGAVAGTDYVAPNGTVANATLAATATKLATDRTIKVGNSAKIFNGTANVEYTLTEIGAAPTSHTQAASTISGGTFSGTTAVVANKDAVKNLTTKQVRNIHAGTADIGVGASLPAGDIYIVYEA